MTRTLAALALAIMAAAASPAVAMSAFPESVDLGNNIPMIVRVALGALAMTLLAFVVVLVSQACDRHTWKWPMRFFFAATSLTAFLMSGVVFAQTACPEHYLNGRPPEYATPAPGTAVELCNDAFADLYDRAGRTPLYAAEHVTTQSLDQGADVERANAFHADHRLKPEESAHPEDYVGSGYDKGHLAPDHDMPTAQAKRQSDSLANVVRQDPNSNRGLWSHIERATRGSATGGLDAYVVTGPIFDDARTLNGIPIPTRLWKALYRPAGRTAPALVGVWVVRNAPNSPIEMWSLDRLRAEIGLDPFPSLSVEDHARLDLPTVAGR